MHKHLNSQTYMQGILAVLFLISVIIAYMCVQELAHWDREALYHRFTGPGSFWTAAIPVAFGAISPFIVVALWCRRTWVPWTLSLMLWYVLAYFVYWLVVHPSPPYLGVNITSYLIRLLMVVAPSLAIVLVLIVYAYKTCKVYEAKACKTVHIVLTQMCMAIFFLGFHILALPRSVLAMGYLDRAYYEHRSGKLEVAEHYYVQFIELIDKQPEDIRERYRDARTAAFMNLYQIEEATGGASRFSIASGGAVESGEDAAAGTD